MYEGAALHQPFHQPTQPNQIKKEFSIWFDFIDFFIVDEINGIELNCIITVYHLLLINIKLKKINGINDSWWN